MNIIKIAIVAAFAAFCAASCCPNAAPAAKYTKPAK